MAILPKLDTAIISRYDGPKMDSAFLSELFWDSVSLESEDDSTALRHLSTYCHDDFSFAEHCHLSPIEKGCNIATNDVEEPEHEDDEHSPAEHVDRDESNTALQLCTKAGSSQRCQQIIQLSSNAPRNTPKSLPRIFTTPPDNNNGHRRQHFWPDSPHPMISPRPLASSAIMMTSLSSMTPKPPLLSATPKTSLMTIPLSFLDIFRNVGRSQSNTPGTTLLTAIPLEQDIRVIDVDIKVNSHGNVGPIKNSCAKETREKGPIPGLNFLAVPMQGGGMINDSKLPYFVTSPGPGAHSLDALWHAKRGGRVIEL